MSHTEMLILILKSIGLLVLEDDMKDNPNLGSKDVIRDVLDNLNIGNRTSIESVDNRVMDAHNVLNGLLTSSDVYIDNVKDIIHLTFKDDPTLIEIFDGVILVPKEDIEKTAVRVYRYISNIRRDLLINKVMRETAFKLGLKMSDVDKAVVVDNMLDKVGTISKTSGLGVEKESFSINDKVKVSTVFEEAIASADYSGKLTTAFKLFNLMLRGGLGKGEFIMYQSLQHKYKSGMAVTMLLSACLYNKPSVENETIVYASFEDKLSDTFTFMFNYLYKREFKKMPNLAKFTPEYMEKYVVGKLTATGFNVEFIKGNPSDWNYKRLFLATDVITKTVGPIRLFIVDYLAKIPTTGCLMTGGTGSDLRDLYRRTRNHYSASGTTFWTPHQLGPRAKDLLASGLPDASFVRRVAGGGYGAISTQLDQEVDIELNGHKVKEDGHSYLTISLGKHRAPGVVAEKYTWFVVPFPDDMGPIIGDVDTEETLGYHTFQDAVDANIDIGDDDIF